MSIIINPTFALHVFTSVDILHKMWLIKTTFYKRPCPIAFLKNRQKHHNYHFNCQLKGISDYFTVHIKFNHHTTMDNIKAENPVWQNHACQFSGYLTRALNVHFSVDKNLQSEIIDKSTFPNILMSFWWFNIGHLMSRG